MNEIAETIKKYDRRNLSIGCIGSHSALNIAEGAVTEGFKTHVFCQTGRENTYARYFKSVYHDGRRVKGVIDETTVLPSFHDLLEERWQKFIRDNSMLWIPNRSFWVYCGKNEIQERFNVPIIGSRHLLHLEDREEQEFNYYNVVEDAGIRTPKCISPDEIDGLVMIKVPHAVHKLERGFFTATTTDDYFERLEDLINRNIIAKEDVDRMRIEEYALGPVCNANFFYSPISKELGEEPLELMSTEWRFESNLDGVVRLPADEQLKLKSPTYIVVGHSIMTLRESLLNGIFDMAERFIHTVKEIFPPGMIGPFGLQCIIEDDMKPTCYDVAFRIPGGDNITGYWGHVYLNTLWHQRMSTGRRLAIEIKRAVEEDLLESIVT